MRGNMVGREVNIGPAIGYNFEIGARFFAALAFPSVHEDASRANAETAWTASHLHKQNKVDGTTAPFQDDRLNVIAAHTPRWARQILRTTKRRVLDRSKAARAVRPWISELVFGNSHPPVSGIKKFTQRQVSIWLCNGDEEQGVRFQERVWRPARPVLHYAIAIDEASYPLDSPENEIEIAISAVQVFRAVVARGAELAPYLAADRRFGISPEEQLHLVWRE